MKFEVKKVENAKVELICTVDGDKWKDACKKAFKKLSSNIEIKGFRKGQAPESVLKKHISEVQTRAEAAQMLAQETFTEGVKENDLEVIDRPDLKLDNITEDFCQMTFVCPVEPDVELGDYKNLGYKVDEVSVDESEINSELDRLKAQKAEIVVKEEGVVEDGDIAVFDFEGLLDGQPFKGGSAENYELTIGSGRFIPGFEDQMKGMKAEEEKDLNVTFPEDYPVADLKAKPVVFKVKLHEIKKKVLAEIDDELIKDLKIENVNTVDEYKNYVKENILKTKKADAENKALETAVLKLIDESKIDIPPVMIEQETEAIFEEYTQTLMQNNLTVDQFLESSGKTLQEVKKGFEAQATKRVKTSLCLKKISAIEKLSVSEEEIDKEIENIATQYAMPLDEVKKYVDRRRVQSDLKLRKALEFIKK